MLMVVGVIAKMNLTLIVCIALRSSLVLAEAQNPKTAKQVAVLGVRGASPARFTSRFAVMFITIT